MSLPGKDYVAISLKDSSVSYPPSAKLFCNICSCNLILLDAVDPISFCEISYLAITGIY
jgi:hypothetical protein